MDTRRARLILNALPNIGPVTIRRLADEFGPDPAAIFSIPRDRLMSVKGVGPAIVDTIRDHRTLFNAQAEEERIAARGIAFLTPEDPEFPPLLRETYDPPVGLYSQGTYRPDRRCVAIVGTRAPTPYGKALARETASNLAKAGWCIVSGLARGVDTAAHRAALDCGGKTAAILGCGIDVVYPPENAGLYRDIAAEGVLFSEFPLGRSADKRTFPMRNRLVAGMCSAVVVIESDIDGGSMITARFAAEQGRTVCAFPGRTDQPTSRGCHALIRDGATLVTSTDEILEELGEAPRETAGPAANPPRENRREDCALLKAFAGGARHTPDSLAESTGRRVGEISAELLMLELDGKIARTLDGSYERLR